MHIPFVASARPESASKASGSPASSGNRLASVFNARPPLERRIALSYVRVMPNRISQQTLEGWIADFGLESQPHTEHDADFEWGLLVSGQAFKTIVAQRRSDFNYLAMQVTVAVSAEHREVVRKLDDESRATFLFDLRLALHSQSVGHSIQLDGAEPGGQPDLPLLVTVGTNLTEERICRADFFKANHAIQTGASIVALMFQRLAQRKRWP